MSDKLLIPSEQIEKSILLIRGHKVMLDEDLAVLYGVETKRLNEQVKRNNDRFPADFMFQLTKEEFENLKSQFATSSLEWGGRRKLPYVFTEQGVAMLSSVLQSKRAVQVNIEIMRAFVKLRKMIASNTKLALRLDDLERKMGAQDIKIKAVFDAIKQLMESPKKKSNPIGFKQSKK